MNIAAERELTPPPQMGVADEERETLDVVRYWRAVSRNRWRILALVAAVGILAAMFASGLPPVYRSTATILIEPNKPKVVSIEEVYSSLTTTQQYFQTQVEILNPFNAVTPSKDVSADIVNQMGPAAAIAVGLAVRKVGDR